MRYVVVAALLLLIVPRTSEAQLPGETLSNEQVARFAELALAGIPREFPNKPSNLMTGPESVLGPRELHPVFFGSYDWHSSVHGHWMLVRLLRLSPDAPIAGEIRALLNRQLTAPGLAAEAAYFDKKENRSFERMYGWAWTLRLAAELRSWNNADARRWAKNLEPLERQVVELTKDYLPRLTYPIRTGVHPDTAFALGQTLDYARLVGDAELERLVVDFSREKYLGDRDYPLQYEPSGEDFFSAGWNEADLMRRVLPPTEFAAWLGEFVPAFSEASPAIEALLEPAVVSDVTDPKIVHLVGFNLSRGWTLRGVFNALPADDARRPRLERAVVDHTRAGMEYVFSGHYEGEHWLATFAVYLLTDAGLPADSLNDAGASAGERGKP